MAKRVVSPAQSRTGGTRIQDVGARMRYTTRDCFVVDPQNQPAAGIAEFWPQNLTVTVTVGIGGGTWYHHEWYVETKQLRPGLVEGPAPLLWLSAKRS
jgi:hypothetical protein